MGQEWRLREEVRTEHGCVCEGAAWPNAHPAPSALEAIGVLISNPLVCLGYAQGLLCVPETTDGAELYTLRALLCMRTRGNA